jgi:hypothetical protein
MSAAYVWSSPRPQGRNEFAAFRRAFTLAARPARAEFHLFADTRYRLTVNGVIVGHGPSRFKRQAPEYDTHDLAPFLRAGENVIGVLVNSHGDGTFLSDPGPGGFIAWGACPNAADAAVDLATPGAWLACSKTGYARWTMPFSFAIGPGEDFDSRVLAAGWNAPGYLPPADAWQAAVQPATPDDHGPLTPRSIPPLQEVADRAPQQSHRLALLRPPANVFSATLTDFAPGLRSVALGLTLHAPRAGDFSLELSLAHLVVNGVVQAALAPVPDFHPRENTERQTLRVSLVAGDNRLWAVCPVRAGMVEFALGWSADAGLDAPTAVGLTAASTTPADELARTLAAAPPATADLRPLALNAGADALPAYLARGWSTPARRSPEGLFPWRAGSPDEATTWVCDFGREVLVRVDLEFEARPGTTLDLTYSERPTADGRTHVGFQTARMLDRCVARGGRQRWTTFHPRGFRYLEIIVHTPGADFALHGVRGLRLRPPFAENGRFRCSDSTLNQIWDLCRETQIATLEDAYTDCPWRERGLYTGDQIIQYHLNLALFGDHTFMRRCIALFYQTQAPTGLLAPCSHFLAAPRHPDYAALSVESLWHYWARSGDLAFVHERADGLERLLEGLHGLRTTEGGLADATGMIPYIDLARTDRDGASCALNCFVQGAFARGSELLALVNRHASATRWAGQARNLAQAIRDAFWDAPSGAFLSRRRADRPDATPSAVANSLALYYEVATGDQIAPALAYLERCAAANTPEPAPRRSTDFHISPYGAFYALAVFYRHGRDTVAERFQRAEWRRMLDGGAWACWEYFVPSHSLCHPWAASPGWYLPAYVLGVRPSRAGDPDELLIDPRPGTLEWAEGVYPHPRGPVRVAWRREGERLVVTHDAPPGVRVTVL